MRRMSFWGSPGAVHGLALTDKSCQNVYGYSS